MMDTSVLWVQGTFTGDRDEGMSLCFTGEALRGVL